MCSMGICLRCCCGDEKVVIPAAQKVNVIRNVWRTKKLPLETRCDRNWYDLAFGVPLMVSFTFV